MTAKDPTAVVIAWRDEIAAELEEATKAVPPLEVALAEAVSAVREALEYYNAVHGLLRAGIVALEAPIQLRLEELHRELDDAKSRKASAVSALKAAKDRVRKLRLALMQINGAIPAEETEEAA
jgi:hypothetical protein